MKLIPHGQPRKIDAPTNPPHCPVEPRQSTRHQRLRRHRRSEPLAADLRRRRTHQEPDPHASADGHGTDLSGTPDAPRPARRRAHSWCVGHPNKAGRHEASESDTRSRILRASSRDRFARAPEQPDNSRGPHGSFLLRRQSGHHVSASASVGDRLEASRARRHRHRRGASSFVDPAARRTSRKTSASSRRLAASVQAPRRGFGDEQGARVGGQETSRGIKAGPQIRRAARRRAYTPPSESRCFSPAVAAADWSTSRRSVRLVSSRALTLRPVEPCSCVLAGIVRPGSGVAACIR